MTTLAAVSPPKSLSAPRTLGRKENRARSLERKKPLVVQKSSPNTIGPPISLLRLLFFCYYASLGSLLPYLPVYYSSLGHDGQVIGLLGAVKPFTTFLVAPLWGVLADARDSYTIWQCTFVTSALLQFALSWSPHVLYIMTMVFWTALFNAPVKSLLDSMVLTALPSKSLYGRLRLWGQVGFGVGSSVIGYVLSKSVVVSWPDTVSVPAWMPWPEGAAYLVKAWRSLTGYKLLFCAYAALSIPTWMCMQRFKQHVRQQDSQQSKRSTKTKKERPNLWQGLSIVLQNPNVLLFFSLVLVVGISSGVIENFAYVRMREVGGTGKEMGLSRLVSSMAGAPMFWYSGMYAAGFRKRRTHTLVQVPFPKPSVPTASWSFPSCRT